MDYGLIILPETMHGPECMRVGFVLDISGDINLGIKYQIGVYIRGNDCTYSQCARWPSQMSSDE